LEEKISAQELSPCTRQVRVLAQQKIK